MLNILPSLDNETVSALKTKLFADTSKKGLAFILYDAGVEIGLAELTVADSAVIHRLGVLPVADKLLAEDFFIRALLFRLIKVSSNIEIGYLNNDYLKFGFKIKNNRMTASADKISFPSDCKG